MRVGSEDFSKNSSDLVAGPFPKYLNAWARSAFGNVLKGPLRFQTVEMNKKGKQ